MNEIHNLEEFIKEIKECNKHGDCPWLKTFYYRGLSKREYKLIPTLSHIREGYTNDYNTYIGYEKDIIERAKLEYPDIFSDNNQIDELALLQHYGFPTRLMDVTENPLVALYFACISNQESDGEVFIFNTGINAKTYTSYNADVMIKEQKIAFVRAKTLSNRQRAQQGLFMWIPNDKLLGIEKDIANNPIIYKVIVIPHENKEDLLKELKMIGISSKSLFPDNMDIISKELIGDITKGALKI